MLPQENSCPELILRTLSVGGSIWNSVYHSSKLKTSEYSLGAFSARRFSTHASYSRSKYIRCDHLHACRVRVRFLKMLFVLSPVGRLASKLAIVKILSVKGEDVDT